MRNRKLESKRSTQSDKSIDVLYLVYNGVDKDYQHPEGSATIAATRTAEKARSSGPPYEGNGTESVDTGTGNTTTTSTASMTTSQETTNTSN